jgi:hypothetical protein
MDYNGDREFRKPTGLSIKPAVGLTGGEIMAREAYPAFSG